jgi:CPA2 family monovalent cation:H+ antiporter-2
LVGILILVFLAGLGNGGVSGAGLAWLLPKLVLIVGSWFALGYLLVTPFIGYVGRHANDETLALLALGLCLGLVVLAAQFHYSAALGAFVMGSILAETSEVRRIEHLVAPVRDVFAAVFFVSTGMLLNPRDITAHWLLVAVITVLTVVGKIASTALGARITGQSLGTSLRAGFSMAQIGEFSFIIAGLGISMGVMSPFLYPVAVSVSVITTFLTPYLVRLSGHIDRW